MVPELLEALDFRSNNEVHRPVIRALEVKQYAGTKLHNFPADENVPLDFVPPLWRDAVVEDEVEGRPRINRITYEIAALNALREYAYVFSVCALVFLASIPLVLLLSKPKASAPAPAAGRRRLAKRRVGNRTRLAASATPKCRLENRQRIRRSQYGRVVRNRLRREA